MSSEVSLAMENLYRWWQPTLIAGVAGLTTIASIVYLENRNQKTIEHNFFAFLSTKENAPLSESDYKKLASSISRMNDVNQQGRIGTPLHYIMSFDPFIFTAYYTYNQLDQDLAVRSKLTKLLLNAKAEVNNIGFGNLIPLWNYNSNVPLIGILLDAKANPNIGNKNCNHSSLIDRSLYGENDTRLIPLLIAHGGQYRTAITKVLTQDHALFDQAGNDEAFRAALCHIGDCSLASQDNSVPLLLKGYQNREWTNAPGKKIPWKGATILFQHQLQRETKAARIFRQLQLFPCAVEDIVIDYFQVMDHHSPVEQPIIKPEFVAMMMQNAQSANTQHRP